MPNKDINDERMNKQQNEQTRTNKELNFSARNVDMSMDWMPCQHRFCTSLDCFLSVCFFCLILSSFFFFFFFDFALHLSRAWVFHIIFILLVLMHLNWRKKKNTFESLPVSNCLALISVHKFRFAEGIVMRFKTNKGIYYIRYINSRYSRGWRKKWNVVWSYQIGNHSPCYGCRCFFPFIFFFKFHFSTSFLPFEAVQFQLYVCVCVCVSILKMIIECSDTRSILSCFQRNYTSNLVVYERFQCAQWAHDGIKWGTRIQIKQKNHKLTDKPTQYAMDNMWPNRNQPQKDHKYLIHVRDN